MKKIPLRMCIGCREMKPKRDLSRIVKSPEGAISFDTTQKMPGRGAYICIDPACFEKAIKTKALSRAFKTTIPESIYISIQENLNG